MVPIPGAEDDTAYDKIEEVVNAARDDVLNMLNAYPVAIWGLALGAAVAALFQSKQDAEEIAQEEKDKAAEG